MTRAICADETQRTQPIPARVGGCPDDLLLVGPGGRLLGRLGDEVVVGSAAGCGVRLADPTVSRRHLRLCRAAEGVLVEDLGSRNGTYLGGARVFRARVEPGARIDAGAATIWLVRGGERESATFEGMVADNVGMRLVFERVRRAAPGRAPVLVAGETGTGKELIARALHRLGRPDGPLAVLNCGAIPHDLCESELFGHEKGAFTGALARRRGVFEEASGGTLFLDEIGELARAMQPKLLRALESGTVRRVGSCEDRRVDVRVVAATNRDLRDEVAHGRFRADLYHRLAAVVLRLPPLRERPDDIPLLVGHFLDEEAREGRAAVLAAGTMDVLVRQPWPGNVRELRNAVRRAVLLGGPSLGPEDFESDAPPAEGDDHPTHVAVAGRTEREILRDVYRKQVALCGGSARLAARALGVPRSTFAERLRRYGVTA